MRFHCIKVFSRRQRPQFQACLGEFLFTKTFHILSYIRLSVCSSDIHRRIWKMAAFDVNGQLADVEEYSA